MKKLILIVTFISGSFLLKAQDDVGKKGEKIEALKIAFITQKLDLTPEEAERFWPVYNRYESELKQTVKDNRNTDVIETDEKLLNLKKRYRAEFIRVVGQPKMNRLFNAEREFRGILIRRLKNRNQFQRPINPRR